MAHMYAFAAHKTLMVMRALGALAVLSVAIIAAAVFRFNIGGGMVQSVSMMFCIACFPVITPRVFKTIQNKTDSSEYTPSFYLMLTSSLFGAFGVVASAGFYSIPFLMVPLLFTTLRIDKEDTLLESCRKSDRCAEQSKKFSLSMDDMENILNGKPFVAEDEMFRIRVEKPSMLENNL